VSKLQRSKFKAKKDICFYRKELQHDIPPGLVTSPTKKCTQTPPLGTHSPCWEEETLLFKSTFVSQLKL